MSVIKILTFFKTCEGIHQANTIVKSSSKKKNNNKKQKTFVALVLYDKIMFSKWYFLCSTTLWSIWWHWKLYSKKYKKGLLLLLYFLGIKAKLSF